MLQQLVINYLVATKGIDLSLFNQPDLQVAALGLDSLDMVEMLFEIEDRCGFQLNDPMRYLGRSFADMLADIETQVRAHHHGALPALDLEPGR